ncbi:MAG: carboxypeptidase regulatory-like domain-containing protein [Pyrinomonadaceae bacterium]
MKFRLTTLMLSILLAATAASAQGGATGSLTGTVRDPNGAGVAGAVVEVTNEGTGERRNATTNEQGGYTVPNLPVGLYDITANAAGFATNTAKGVKVSVSFTTDMDMTVNPAGATESVTVVSTDTQTTVNSTDQALSTLIDNKKILDLPLLSRDPNSLILISPGTTTSDSRLGGFVVNGQRERNNNFQVDGVDNNDTEVPGGRFGVATPTIDATQEFRVLTSSYNAEFGRNSGAVINVVTKSGTNEFHGNAYIYYRSDAFSARDFFDISGQPDPLQRRQWGGSIGGPIVKDRIFFFTNYERDIYKLGQQVVRVVPSALARQGILQTGAENFGTLDIRQGGANNFSGPILDFVYGAPDGTFSNLGVNPAITDLLNRIYPLGNSPADAPLPGVFDAFRFASTLNFNDSHQVTSRVDTKLTDKHNLAGSFTWSKGNGDVFPETFPGRNDGGNAPFKSFNVGLNLASVFNSNLINEARLGVNRVVVDFNLPGTGGEPTGAYGDVLTAFQSHGVPQATQVFGGENGRLIDLTGTGGITALNTLGVDSQFRHAGTMTIGDSLTLIRGNQTWKFGGEGRFIYSNGANNFFRKEFLNFGITGFGLPLLLNNAGDDFIPVTGLGGSVNDYASFLYGLVVQQQQWQYYNKAATRVDADYLGIRQREFDLFAQNAWKVRPNLTLNLGLRWEYKGVPYEVNGQLSNLIGADPSGPTPAGGFRFETVGKNSENPGRSLYDEDYNNFAPRVGFNYSPDFSTGWLSKLTGGPGNMTIRGGFGIYYDRVFGNIVRNSSTNPPFQNTFNNFAFDILQNVPRPTTIGSDATIEDGAELSVNLFPLPGNNMFQQHFKTPYTETWNFGVQRQFKGNILAEADYVGSHGVSLLRGVDAQAQSVLRVNAIRHTNVAVAPNNPRQNFLNGVLNTAFGGAAAAYLNASLGQSTYNGMQLRLTKRLSNTFIGAGQFQAAYTWSHSIDNAPDPLDAGRGGRSAPRDSSGFGGGFGAERGNSDFDTRHRFVANFVYDLPFKSSNGFVNQVVGDWTVAGIVTLQSGTPFSIFGSRDSVGAGLSQRASYAAPGQGLTATPNETAQARTQVGPSRTLFRQPNAGEIGNVQRNSFYGDGYQNTDLSVIKRFRVREGVLFRVQADFFNLFNNVNLFNPSNALFENSIGQPTFGQSSAAFPARRIQFAARLEF